MPSPPATPASAALAAASAAQSLLKKILVQAVIVARAESQENVALYHLDFALRVLIRAVQLLDVASHRHLGVAIPQWLTTPVTHRVNVVAHFGLLLRVVRTSISSRDNPKF